MTTLGQGQVAGSLGFFAVFHDQRQTERLLLSGDQQMVYVGALALLEMLGLSPLLRNNQIPCGSYAS